MLARQMASRYGRARVSPGNAITRNLVTHFRKPSTFDGRPTLRSARAASSSLLSLDASHRPRRDPDSPRNILLRTPGAAKDLHLVPTGHRHTAAFRTIYSSWS